VVARRWLQERAEAISAEALQPGRDGGRLGTDPEQDVADAMQKMPPTTLSNLDQKRAQLGHDVSADVSSTATVEKYQERVGADYAAASPASGVVLAQVRRSEGASKSSGPQNLRSRKPRSARIFSTWRISCSDSGRWCAALKSRRKA